ncbi:MAG: tyrosine-protein phosphatase [Bacteroidales bacterium]|nr:tyrosine-protein phosphatase [Bacteroidales bacterium]
MQNPKQEVVENYGDNISFNSILNFRDAGGLSTISGGSVRKGIIYRSANPDRISKKDIKSLKKLGIKTIVDLRAPGEFRKRKAEIPDIEVINLPLDFEGVTRQRIRPLIKRNFNPDEIDKTINELYLEIIDAAGPVLAKIAGLLLIPDKTPLLIHCQAGKDRTGILAAMLQMIAGAEKEEIVRDYMASNDSLVPYFSRKLSIRTILTFGLFPSAAILHAVKQKERDIETVIERIEERYGGIKEYISVSGFNVSDFDRLRDILREG